MSNIKFGNLNNEVAQNQNFVEYSCRSAVLLLYFLFCFVLLCYFSYFQLLLLNIAVIGVDQAIVKHLLKEKLKGPYGLYT